MIEKLGIIFGILATICTGIYFLIKEFRKKQLDYRERLDKKWLNEGDITGFGAYSHFVYLDLSVDKRDGEIVGTLDTRPLRTKEDLEYTLISANGTLYYNTAKISLTKVSRGKVLEFGTARIILKKKHLYWKLLKGNSDMFPKKTILWSNSNYNFIRTPDID